MHQKCRNGIPVVVVYKMLCDYRVQTWTSSLRMIARLDFVPALVEIPDASMPIWLEQKEYQGGLTVTSLCLAAILYQVFQNLVPCFHVNVYLIRGLDAR